MNLLWIVGSIAVFGLCYGAVVLLKHWESIQQVTARQLDLPVLNLEGNGFAEAEKSYFDNLPCLLRDGYQKYRHGFYQLFTPTGYLVIASAGYFQEMNQLPEGTLDFHAASQKRVIGDYTWLQIADELLSHTIRTDLTKHLEWTPVSIRELGRRLITITMGRILVGPCFNREDEWACTVTKFVSDVYIGGLKLKGFSHFTRPFAARFLVPEIRRVRHHQATARRKLIPLLKVRLASSGGIEGKNANKPKALDLLQWLVDNNLKQPKPKTLEQLAELALVAYVGSTNTTATTLAKLLLDLAVRPGDVDVLRDEIRAMGLNGGYDVDDAPEAELLHNPRIVRNPFTLSNGLTLPLNTHLMIPASMISTDEEIYKQASEFNGFRFSDARAESPPESTQKYQLTTSSPQAMHFGYGRNACPGRFFAAMVVKVFAVGILLRFDLEITGDGMRPKSRAVGSRNSPPGDVKLLLRYRE
ncbi:cytochrome P450 [Aspergillus californicus]